MSRSEQESSQSEEVGFVGQLLARLASVGCRWPRWVLAGTLLSCLLCLAYTWAFLTYHNQRNDIHSPNSSYLRRWQQYVAEFGDDDDMVVVVEGANRPRLELTLEDLAREIQKYPESFDRLFYKVDLRSLRDRSLLFLPASQIRQVQEHIAQFSLMINPPALGILDPFFGWRSLTLYQLLKEGERRLDHPDDKYLDQLEAMLRGASSFLADEKAYKNPWLNILNTGDDRQKLLDEPQYFFSSDDSLAFLLVRPLKEKEGFTFAQKSIDTLKKVVSDVGARHPGIFMGLTGLPVLENDEIVASQNDSNLASWLALAGVALLYFVVYRGFRYPLMTVATLIVGTIWALGWLTLTVGHLNILSSAFAVMLIGMGDYGILWVIRFNQERQGGSDRDEAMTTTARAVGTGILTAALTTAFSFYAAMLADLRAVAELGWIAGSGVLLCALACFIVLPALLTLFGKIKKTNDPAPILSLEEHQEQQRQWLPGLTHRPIWVLPVVLGSACVLGYFALGIRYDHNLLRLQAEKLESVQWEKKLIAKTEGAGMHALSYTSTPEEAISLKARYEMLPEVGRVVEVASLVPRDQDRKIELLRDIQARLNPLPPRGQLLERDVPNLRDVHLGIVRLLRGIRPGDRLAGLEKALHQMKETLVALGDDAAGKLKVFEQLLTRDLAEDLHRLREVSKPAQIKVADLPSNLRERYLGKNDKWLLRIFAKESLWDYEPLARFVSQVRTVDTEATGKPFTTLEGLEGMRSGFFWAGIYALIAMVFVLLLDFESVRHTTFALAPLFLGLIATLGLMALFGLPLNPANMIAFPLILGVGADNGVHVMHDFRSRNRREPYSLSWATGRGIMVAALTTILGFGTLMISQHRGMASLGLVLTLGVTCCMGTALIFLPALLRLVSLQRLASRRQSEATASRKKTA